MTYLSFDITSRDNRSFSIRGRIEMKILNMSAEAIRSMISDEMMRKIKFEDPNPEFRAYVVGHEGTAYPKEVGAGSVVMKWFRSAIEKLVDTLRVGTKIFHNHNEDSTHGGRISIGEVVGKAFKRIKDKASAVAVMYIYPQFRSLPLDIASVEADVKVDPQSADTFEAVGVNEITGIALGDSSADEPAFSGAKLIGEMQAFKDRSIQGGNMGDKVTIDEMKTVIKENEIKPSDLFGNDKIADDPFVVGLVKSAVKEETAGEYGHRKRDGSAYEKKITELEDSAKEKDTKIAELQKTGAKGDVKKKFKDEAEKRKFTDRQKEFIEGNLEEFDLKDVEKIDSELSEFLDDQVDAYKKVSKVFGIEEKNDEENEAGEKGEKKETEKKDNGSKKESTTPPGDNPFLPTIDE